MPQVCRLPLGLLAIHSIALLVLVALLSTGAHAQSPKLTLPKLALPRTGAEFPPELLAPVADLTAGFPSAERDCYYMLLAHAQSTDLNLQRRAAFENQQSAEASFRTDRKNRRRKHLLFYDIVTHPESWRGQPVTLTGYIRDLTPMEAGENSFGLETLYQAHLFTDDSSQFPYVVICTRIPENIVRPTAKAPTDYVTVTGYFYKLWTYRAGTESGHWSAPLVLANRLEWNPPRGNSAVDPRWYWLAGGGAALVIFGSLVLRNRNRQARQVLRDLATSPAPTEAETRAALRSLERIDHPNDHPDTLE